MSSNPRVYRPPELVSAVLTALSNVALAEAQTVAAARADAKGSSTALVASLHVGVAGKGEAPLMLSPPDAAAGG